MVGVPFERPAELAGRTEVTNEEFAARTERAQKQAVADSEEFVSTAPRTGDGTGPPSHWLEHGKPSRQASLVVAPADGKLPPMTPEGQRRAALNRNTYVMFSGFTDASDMGPYDRCITRGVMGSTLPVIYNNGNQIFQMPGYVVIRYEMIHETRVIPLDGRAHAGNSIRMYMGDGRGHWEGQTLVVETTNLNGKPNYSGGKITERFTRAESDLLLYEATIDDPKTYTRIVKIAIPLTSPPGYQVLPYDCHEGNSAVYASLGGQRAEDRAIEEDRKKGIIRPRRSIQEHLNAGGRPVGELPPPAPTAQTPPASETPAATTTPR
jgi:hypothetical protein